MLDEIVEKTQERLVEAKNIKSLDELKKEVSQMEISKDFPFKEVLKDPEIAIIAEVKKGDVIKMQKSENKTIFLRKKDFNFFNRLTEKLKENK